MGKALVVVGLVIVIIGVILMSGGEKMFSWFGKLPGDIRVERPNFKFYAPIASMLLISVLLSVILWLINRIR